MKVKYKLRFNIQDTELDKIRDIKIDTLISNNALEVDSDEIPRIPKDNEIIKINGVKYGVMHHDAEWIFEGDEVYNIFTIHLSSLERGSGSSGSLGWAQAANNVQSNYGTQGPQGTQWPKNIFSSKKKV